MPNCDTAIENLYHINLVTPAREPVSSNKPAEDDRLYNLRVQYDAQRARNRR